MAASPVAVTVGDLLGALLVAPPLLWAADRVRGRPLAIGRPRPAQVAEAAGVTALATGAVAPLSLVGPGLPATPLLLGVAWVGLRFGRAAAWASVAAAAAAAFVLPRTAAASLDLRLQLHMDLAAVVVAGYLAGSLANA